MKIPQAIRRAGIRSFCAFAVCLLMLLQIHVASAQDNRENRRNAVFVMNNEASGNEIVMLQRAEDGTLARAGNYATGGLGSGPGPLPAAFGGPGPGPLPLESQDSLISTPDGRFLIAVNAGSNDVSVMEITHNGLEFKDKAPSGGIFPVTLAIHDNLVYVVNLGAVPTLTDTPGTPTMSGFFLDGRGKLHPIPNSTRVTGAFGSSPADIVFSPDGRFLVLAERVTSQLDVFPVHHDGLMGDKVVTPSNNLDPFGMEFTKTGVLVVTEGVDESPRMPLPNGSSTSSYRLREDGSLQTISGAVPTHQSAACWVRFSKSQNFAYVVNSGSGTISTYSISSSGDLTLLLVAAGDTGGPFSAAIDEAVTTDGKFLYVDSPLVHALRGFRIESDGSLTLVTQVDGFPVSFSGAVAF